MRATLPGWVTGAVTTGITSIWALIGAEDSRIPGGSVRLRLTYGMRTALAAEIWFRKGIAHRQRNELDEAEAGWRRVLGLHRPEKFTRPPVLMASSRAIAAGRDRGGGGAFSSFQVFLNGKIGKSYVSSRV